LTSEVHWLTFLDCPVFSRRRVPRYGHEPRSIILYSERSASSCLGCELIAWRISVSGLLGACASVHRSIS